MNKELPKKIWMSRNGQITEYNFVNFVGKWSKAYYTSDWHGDVKIFSISTKDKSHNGFKINQHPETKNEVFFSLSDALQELKRHSKLIIDRITYYEKKAGGQKK